MTDPTPDVPTLRRLLAEATPGPWEHYGDHLVWPSSKGPAANDPICATGDGHDDYAAGEFPHAALIVAAVNALPGILDRLEAAEGAVARCAELAADWDNFEHDAAACFKFDCGDCTMVNAIYDLRAALAEVTP